MSPGKIVFGVVPSKTIIGVPGKVVYLHYTTVYCACLSVVPVETKPDGYLVWKESFCSSCVLSENVLLCFMYFLSHLVSMLGL